MVHDYVKMIGKPSRPPLDAKGIAGWRLLVELSGELRVINEKVLDLGGLAGLTDLQAPLNPEELERSRILCELVAEFPELEQVAQVQPGVLKDAYSLDMRLIGLKEATGDLRRQAEVGERFLAAQLTETNDRVEDAVTAFVNDATVSAEARTLVRYQFSFPGFAHAWLEDRQRARQLRRGLRQRRLAAELEALARAAEGEERKARLKARDDRALAAPRGKGKEKRS